MLKAIRVTQRGWRAGLDVSNVFIPAGGFCDYTSLYNAGSIGCYWSITYNHPSPALAWLISTSSTSVSWGYTVYPFSGLSIRRIRQEVDGLRILSIQRLKVIIGLQQYTHLPCPGI